MASKTIKSLFLYGFILAIVGCAHGPCRSVPSNGDLTAKAATMEKPADTTSSNDDGTGAKKATSATVVVYKPDGSTQCSAARGKTPEEMEPELTGIQVFSRSKRSDGLMHIQVCGSPTGMVNVFEISEKFLTLAESRGFKKWDLD